MHNGTPYLEWLGLVRAEQIVRGKLQAERARAQRETDPRGRRFYADVLRADRAALRAVCVAQERLDAITAPSCLRSRDVMLTDEDSMERGIGPVCAKKRGLL